MLRRSSPCWLIPFTLVVLLLAACGDTADDSADTTLAPTTTTEAPTTTAAPATTTAAPASGPFRVTFDGEECTYEGPTELNAGPVAIDFVNEMEEAAAGEWPPTLKVNLMRHDGDETVQDMIDYTEEDHAHQPSWVSNPRPHTWEYPVSPGETVHWEGNLEPGTHTLNCTASMPAFGVWFGTGLIVED